jgi:hypothetical protein
MKRLCRGLTNFQGINHSRGIVTDVVFRCCSGVEHYHFEDIIEMYKEDKCVYLDTDLDAEDWEEISHKFKAKASEVLERAFPDDLIWQLWGSTTAFFGPLY